MALAEETADHIWISASLRKRFQAFKLLNGHRVAEHGAHFVVLVVGLVLLNGGFDLFQKTGVGDA
jgi:hypothetical protein